MINNKKMEETREELYGKHLQRRKKKEDISECVRNIIAQKEK